MVTWNEFEAIRPDLATAGRELLYQVGVGLAFLATSQPDGSPRVPPMCPILTEYGLHALIIPSPKLRDLERDGRYAMHSFPTDTNEDAFYATGMARRCDDASVRAAIDALWLGERKMDAPPPGFDTETLVEFDIATCLLTRTTGHGDHDPQHTVWKAGG